MSIMFTFKSMLITTSTPKKNLFSKLFMLYLIIKITNNAYDSYFNLKNVFFFKISLRNLKISNNKKQH